MHLAPPNCQMHYHMEMVLHKKLQPFLNCHFGSDIYDDFMWFLSYSSEVQPI